MGLSQNRIIMSSLFVIIMTRLAMKTIYHPTYQLLIKHLIELRKIKGLTQLMLAEGLGKPQSYIAKIEGCERKVDVLEFVELCRILEVSASEIILLIE